MDGPGLRDVSSPIPQSLQHNRDPTVNTRSALRLISCASSSAPRQTPRKQVDLETADYRRLLQKKLVTLNRARVLEEKFPTQRSASNIPQSLPHETQQAIRGSNS